MARIHFPRLKIDLKIDINWGYLGKRIGGGMAAAAATAAIKPELLTTRTGLLSLAATGIGAMIPFGGGGSAGILTSAAPGAASLAQAALAVITAPAQQRKQDAAALKSQALLEAKMVASEAGAAAAQALLNKTNMAGFAPGQLGLKTLEDSKDSNQAAPAAAPSLVAGTEVGTQ